MDRAFILSVPLTKKSRSIAQKRRFAIESEVGKRCKKRRLAAGISLHQMSQLTGRLVEEIARYENQKPGLRGMSLGQLIDNLRVLDPKHWLVTKLRNN